MVMSVGRDTRISRPPRRRDAFACSTIFGSEAGTIATSTPPSSSMAATGSVVAALITCAAPSWRPSSSFSSLTSTAMVSPPKICAYCCAKWPKPPMPKMATLSPGVTPPTFTTKPISSSSGTKGLVRGNSSAFSASSKIVITAALITCSFTRYRLHTPGRHRRGDQLPCPRSSSVDFDGVPDLRDGLPTVDIEEVRLGQVDGEPDRSTDRQVGLLCHLRGPQPGAGGIVHGDRHPIEVSIDTSGSAPGCLEQHVLLIAERLHTERDDLDHRHRV